MLLIEKDLNNSIRENLKLTDLTLSFRMGREIPKKEFDRLKGNFQTKMDENLHYDEIVSHYFTKSAFDSVRRSLGNGDKVAFVFFLKVAGGPIHIAMLGLVNNALDFNNAFEASTNPQQEVPVSDQDLKNGMGFYEDRIKEDMKKNEKVDFYPCRDKGVVHDLGALDLWLNSVSNHARAFIGVETNDLQNVLLVGDRSWPSGVPGPDDNYAFDKSSGCCP